MTDFLTITVEGNQIIAKVAALPKLLASRLRFQVAAAVIELQNYIRTQKLSGQVLHVRTGNLRNAVRAYPPVSEDFPIQGTVAVDRSAPYGAMQEGGTRPHEIVPVRARALRFVSGGQTVFARRVQHPGFPPHPFMAPSFLERRDPIIARLRLAIEQAVKG
jgi:hypothetical protein